MRCPYPNSIPDPRANNPKIRLVVPCGKCAVCQQNRRQDWSIRLLEESKDYLCSVFVTLTYRDDEELPNNFKTFGNINKNHLKDFFKRLRQKTEREIRYYAVGEYGTKTYRPHFHAIIYNLSSCDRDIIEEAWSIYRGNDRFNKPVFEPIGNVHIGDVTIASMMYVAKYHVNKTSFPDGLVPPFAIMSKGIGRNYIKRMKDYHNKNIDTYYYQYYEQKKRLPRYYKDRLFNETLKAKISEQYQAKANDLQDIEEYIKKYPKNKITGYFKLKHQEILEYQRKFKQKSHLNDKL